MAGSDLSWGKERNGEGFHRDLKALNVESLYLVWTGWKLL
jgi:hypothetical protein